MGSPGRRVPNLGAVREKGEAIVNVEIDDRLIEAIAARTAELLLEEMRRDAQGVDSWMDAKQAAVHLGVHVDTIRRHAASGLIPSHQDGPGSKHYFRRSDLDRWRGGGGAPGHLRAVK